MRIFRGYLFFFGFVELRTPNEAFFHRNPKLLGLGRQFGQINLFSYTATNFGEFRVGIWGISANLSAPISVL